MLFGILFFSLSCQQEKRLLTEADKKAVIESAQITVQKVFDLSNRHQFVEGLQYYSDDSDALYTSNGTIMTLDDLKKSYIEIAPSVEILKNDIKNWKARVLSETKVVFTLPVDLTIKLSGMPEYKGHLVWTGVVQKQNQKWIIVQSHESWLNCIEVAQALTLID